MTPTAESSSARLSDGPRLVALVVLALACLLPLVWPGDVPFINDEPLLIASAVDANREGHLAAHGLPGTFSFTYGPAPVWMYQALVAVDRDLVVVAALHILLVCVATAAALWWLARSLRLWIWFAPLPLLSPYFWFYARVLWDNPLLIPLGALAVAGYAAHLDSGSSTGLRVAIVAMAAIPLVHLMGVALVVPLLAHMLIVRGRALWAHKDSVAVIAVAALWLAWPYWRYLAAPHPRAPIGQTLNGWLFPLIGGRLLSARDLAYFYGPGPVDGAVFGAAAAISWLAYALVWIGIIVAAICAVRAARSRTWTPRAHIAALSLATLGCQSIVNGLSGKFEHPHYHNGIWISFALLAWFAVDFVAMRRNAVRWIAVGATGLLAAALVLAVGTLAVRLHRSGGTRDIYGATLANQQQVARALAMYAPESDVQVHIFMYQQYPHALAILRGLNASPHRVLPRRDLDVRYGSTDPTSGVIVLVER